MLFTHKLFFILGELIGCKYQLSQTRKALQYAIFIEKFEETEIPDLPDDMEQVTENTDDLTTEVWVVALAQWLVHSLLI
ncbi:hypothetical protein DPMN_091417 [Dreissena polymorpha]|uniref:Uncharacterized protein n=1 Tax=Dreissena polymorpha TaxID=45954 RepID=A0A9D4QZZ6_DREPO|nr:hypothetical protein DPMN_091417 [Dreissena polymorpha]